MGADIKKSLFAAVADIKTELRSLTSRVDHTEEAMGTVVRESRITASTLRAHEEIFQDLQRQIEDLDNRGRRHNLRVRGLPELIVPAQVEEAVVAILMDSWSALRTPQSPWRDAIERFDPVEIHRPRRDVICHVDDFKLKEELMKKARDQEPVGFDGVNIQLFQDFSPITLQKERTLNRS